MAADCLGPALLVPPTPFFSLMGNTAKLTKSLMASKGFKGGGGRMWRWRIRGGVEED